jgi:hypothetical protein
MVGGNQGDVGMFASMGIPPEEWEKRLAPEEIEIWPENWPAVEVFSAMLTQWRIGMGGPTGLDYAALPAVMDLLEVERRTECFAGLQVMESEALEVFRLKSNGQ